MKKLKTFGSLSLAIMLACTPLTALAEEAPTTAYQGEISTFGDYTQLYVRISSGNLNVRSNAGTQYSIVGKLANGTRIISWSVFGKKDSDGNSWTPITAKDINGKEISGWVRDDYLGT